MSTAITALLAVIAQLVPSIQGDTSLIGTVINALLQIIPALTKEIEDVVPIIKNIIAALSANPATTADQLKALQAVDAQVDAAFEAAATQATAEEDAAST